jgi:hypothetical protein
MHNNITIVINETGKGLKQSRLASTVGANNSN